MAKTLDRVSCVYADFRVDPKVATDGTTRLLTEIHLCRIFVKFGGLRDVAIKRQHDNEVRP
jgi:hypothetical protein